MKNSETKTNVQTLQTEGKKYTPRGYQSQALAAALEALARDQHPLIVAPTGSGKSLIIAALCANLVADGKRVLVVTHRKELIDQNERHVKAISGENTAEIGVYSAGLGRKENGDHILIAGIQSIYKRPELWQHRDVVIIDEAHLVPPPDKASMYQTLLSGMPNAQRIGLTATPYRLDGGLIYGTGTWFSEVTYQIEAKQLIADEYLSPLVARQALQEIDTTSVGTRQGDFITKELDQVACQDGEVRRAVGEAVHEANHRAHILVFCVSIVHAEMVHETLLDRGESSALVHGKLSDDDRDAAIQSFTAGQCRWLVNVLVLTTGFDYPNIDCIVQLRPTQSKSLHVQCMGRGMRRAEFKADCLVLDFAGNCRRHGDIDLFQDIGVTDAKAKDDKKKADQRRRAQRRLPSWQLSDADPLTGGVPAIRADVVDINFKLTPASRYPGKTNVMVLYKTRGYGTVRKWLCPEYDTGAVWFARRFAQARGVQYPSTDAYDFMLQVKSSRLQPTAVSIRRNERGYFDVELEHFEDA